MKNIETARVELWGKIVGAVTWVAESDYAVFEFDRDFLNLGLDISPVHLKLEDALRGDGIYSFPSLNKTTYHGLPGMLADSLPDKFGNSIIDAWLARIGRDITSFNPVERLCYTNKRGMGALEFYPAITQKYDTSVPVEISEMVKLTQTLMNERKALDVKVNEDEKNNEEAIIDILRVGTSAGGARPKAIIAMNKDGKVMSGQAQAPKDYDYWLLKFDGVTDLELGNPRGFGRIEFAYHLMAKAAGIEMTECRLLEENGRAHFMTKRFDRVNGEKVHMQSLCGIAHYDFNMAGAHSYEQAFAIMRQLRLSKAEIAEQYRRMLFNIIARDLDDHTKNISFLMGPDSKWKLSPAYDVIYSHNPKGKWTNQHQMTANGKRDNFTRDDFLTIANSISLPKADHIMNDVVAAVDRWPEIAKEAGVNKKITQEIKSQQRLP